MLLLIIILWLLKSKSGGVGIRHKVMPRQKNMDICSRRLKWMPHPLRESQSQLFCSSSPPFWRGDCYILQQFSHLSVSMDSCVVVNIYFYDFTSPSSFIYCIVGGPSLLHCCWWQWHVLICEWFHKNVCPQNFNLKVFIVEMRFLNKIYKN